VVGVGALVAGRAEAEVSSSSSSSDSLARSARSGLRGLCEAADASRSTHTSHATHALTSGSCSGLARRAISLWLASAALPSAFYQDDSRVVGPRIVRVPVAHEWQPPAQSAPAILAPRCVEALTLCSSGPTRRAEVEQLALARSSNFPS